MVKKIAWSLLGLDRYKQILEFLILNWSLHTAEEFQKITEQKLLLLAQFPHAGTSSIKNSRFRQLIITKHNKLIYHVKKDTIFIVEIIDTRQKEK